MFTLNAILLTTFALLGYSYDTPSLASVQIPVIESRRAQSAGDAIPTALENLPKTVKPFITNLLSPSCNGGFCVPTIANGIGPTILNYNFPSFNVPSLLGVLPPSIAVLPPSLNSLFPPLVSSNIPPFLIAPPTSPISTSYLCPLPSPTPASTPLTQASVEVTQKLSGDHSDDITTSTGQKAFTRAVQCLLNFACTVNDVVFSPCSAQPVLVSTPVVKNRLDSSNITITYLLDFFVPSDVGNNPKIGSLNTAIQGIKQVFLDKLTSSTTSGKLIETTQRNCLLGYGTVCFGKSDPTTPVFSYDTTIKANTPTSTPTTYNMNANMNDHNSKPNNKLVVSIVVPIIIIVVVGVAIAVYIMYCTTMCQKKQEEEYDSLKSSSQKSFV